MQWDLSNLARDRGGGSRPIVHTRIGLESTGQVETQSGALHEGGLGKAREWAAGNFTSADDGWAIDRHVVIRR